MSSEAGYKTRFSWNMLFAICRVQLHSYHGQFLICLLHLSLKRGRKNSFSWGHWEGYRLWGPCIWHGLKMKSWGSAGISPSDLSRKSPWRRRGDYQPLLCVCKAVVLLCITFLFFQTPVKHSPRNQWVIWLVSTFVLVLVAELLTIPSCLRA